MSKFAFLFLLLSTFTTTLKSQSVDSLIQLNIEARGGYTTLSQINSIIMKGSANIGDQKAEYQVFIKRPDYIRIDLISKNTQLYQIYDGVDAWTYNKMAEDNKLEPMGFIEKNRLISESDIDGPLIHYSEKGHQVSYDGFETVEGLKCHILLIQLVNGSRKRYFIDSKSHQIIKESSFRTVKGNSPLATSLIKVESIYDGFKTFGDLVLPRVITTLMDNQTISVLKINEVITNSIKDDLLFKKESLMTN